MPMRLCLTCRQEADRTILIRILVTAKGESHLFVPPQVSTAHQFGRSVYCCATVACVSGALKGKRLEKALKRPIPDDIIKQLQAWLEDAEKGSSQ